MEQILETQIKEKSALQLRMELNVKWHLLQDHCLVV